MMVAMADRVILKKPLGAQRGIPVQADWRGTVELLVGELPDLISRYLAVGAQKLNRFLLIYLGVLSSMLGVHLGDILPGHSGNGITLSQSFTKIDQARTPAGHVVNQHPHGALLSRYNGFPFSFGQPLDKGSQGFSPLFDPFCNSIGSLTHNYSPFLVIDIIPELCYSIASYASQTLRKFFADSMLPKTARFLCCEPGESTLFLADGGSVESVHLSLLGPVAIERAGAPVQGFESRKAVALLCYLAAEKQPLSRSHLADWFWQDKPEPQGRANLSRVLHNLSSLLPDCLQVDRYTLQFKQSPVCWVDLKTFDELVKDSRNAASPSAGLKEMPAFLQFPEKLTAAANLYRGEFMAGFYLDDCPDFEAWLVTERERWQQRVIDVLQKLADHYTRCRAYEQGREFAARLLELDSWREEAHQQMMRLLACSGQRSAALAQYETCRRVLADELGVEPEPATLELYEQIRSGELNREMERQRAGTDADVFLTPVPQQPQAVYNLPPQPTLFIGRETELAEIAALLADPACRLLTLVGAGGIGKTRLAIEAARHSSLAHGACFVSLAPLSSVEPLVAAVAQAVGLTFYGSNDARQQLFDYLRDQELLLVLDNFEHLLLPLPKKEAASDSRERDDGTRLVRELLEHAPKLKLLVTSRERLNLYSEWIFNVEGLSIPVNGEAEALEAFSAPRLFLQRARRLKREFGQQPEERLCIGQVCRLVGGIPLALELAAAWTKSLSCHEIAREIERNLDFLAASMRDLPERHRSMRAVFDTSWQMLTDQERQLFQRLSICRGGFTRAAAEAIAGDVPWTDDDLQVDEEGELQLTHHQADILNALAGLVDKSFLRYTSSGRYNVHELMRQYGAARLAADPENEARSFDLHAAYYLKLLTCQEPMMKGRGQRWAHQRVAQEFENIKLGWLHAAEQGLTELLTQAFGAFWLSCIERNVFHELANICNEAHRRLEKYLPSTDRLQPPLELALGAMLLGEGGASFRIGDLTLTSKVEQAITLFRSLKADAWTALALNFNGAARQILGNFEAARQNFAESAELSQKAGDRWLAGYSLNDLGLVLHLMGDTAAAQELSRQSLAILTQLDDRRGKAFAFNNLGFYAFHQGDYAEADWLYRECIKLRQVNNDQWGVATGMIHLGTVARARGATHQAHQHLIEAIRTALKVRAWPVVLDALVELAILWADGGVVDRTEEILQVSLHHPALAKPAQKKAEQLLATWRGLAKPPPTARLPVDEAARELDALLATLSIPGEIK